MADDFVYEKINVTNRVFSSFNINEAKTENFKKQNYFTLKNECLKNKRLFVDPEFPASEKSLFYSKPNSFRAKWLRPSEIVRKQNVPRFIVGTNISYI